VTSYDVRPVARVESLLTNRSTAPKQGDEGAPPARVVFTPEFHRAAADLRPGDRLVLLTWLHEADRAVQAVHPRSDPDRPSTIRATGWRPAARRWPKPPARAFDLRGRVTLGS
jgi:tRNA (Thr-GGU) A37 N-methylase